jgi:hypothetical protein
VALLHGHPSAPSQGNEDEEGFGRSGMRLSILGFDAARSVG